MAYKREMSTPPKLLQAVWLRFTFYPGRVRSIAIRASVCVCPSVSPFPCLKKTTCPNFTKFSVHVSCSRGLVFLWQQCSTVMYFRFSGWRHVFVWRTKYTHRLGIYSSLYDSLGGAVKLRTRRSRCRRLHDSREMYRGRARLFLSVCPRPHAYTIARTRMYLVGVVGDAPLLCSIGWICNRCTGCVAMAT